MSPSFTCIRIYGKVFGFSDHPLLGYFSSFDELNTEKKAVTLSQEWLLFVYFSMNYAFFSRFRTFLVALGLRMFAWRSVYSEKLVVYIYTIFKRFSCLMHKYCIFYQIMYIYTERGSCRFLVIFHPIFRSWSWQSFEFWKRVNPL